MRASNLANKILQFDEVGWNFCPALTLRIKVKCVELGVTKETSLKQCQKLLPRFLQDIVLQ